MSHSKLSIDYVQAFKDASITAVLALLLFGPITGLVLSGYSYDAHWVRPMIAAIVVFIGRFVFSVLFQYISQTPNLQGLLPRKNANITVVRDDLRRKQWVFLLIFLVGITIPWFASKYWLIVLVLALVYVLLGLGLNIVVGLAGLLDLGFVAFYAVGAYGYGLGHEYLGLSFWAALPLAALMAACFGAILGFPVLAY